MDIKSGFEGLLFHEQIFLIFGILLFVVALIFLIIYVMRQQAIKWLCVLIGISIVMIGYPSVQKFSFAGLVVELEQMARAVEANPGDAEAQQKLTEIVARVKERSPSSAQTLNAVARADAVLGDTVEALESVHKALRVDSQNVQTKELNTLFNTPRTRVERLIQLADQNPGDTVAHHDLEEELDSLENVPELTADIQATLQRGYQTFYHLLPAEPPVTDTAAPGDTL
ncbi:MAG: hypothetical protein JSW34_10390 [Candidatus Zixiibacteriota bacterium]|nr:MAG: hypothetical protein JSW34_10390 [candidate division Zixibacteria bacterium]